MSGTVSRRSVMRAAGGAGMAGLTATTLGTGDGAVAAGKAPTARPDQLTVSSEPFGTMPDGTPVRRYTFGSAHGVQARAISYGAAFQTIQTPDRHGRTGNIALGLATLDEYRARSPYFGCVVGRYANRIRNGRFALDGTTYQIPVNNGPNALHGGTIGFDKHVWDATEVRGADRVGVRFSRLSPDGEMGFPGNLTASVTYTVNTSGELTIDYHATTDKATIVNLSNHTYWNLAGEAGGTVYDHLLRIDADRYTPIDDQSIPLGPLPSVAGTPFDFRRPTRIGARIREGDTQILNAHGYDHNWVLTGPGGSGGLHPACTVYEPTTGRILSISTDQPGLQFYSGNFLDATLAGTSGHVYRQGDTLVLETQHFPDSPNQPGYPSTVLRPGKEYRSRTVLSFRAG